MSVIGIGDLHGFSEGWHQIIEKENDADRIVFIGDYFDSINISGEKQIQNFRNVIAYKKSNMDKVKLLIGNHEWHYLIGSSMRYKGFQIGRHLFIGDLIESAIKEGLIQMCYTYDNFLFTHAGVTKTWCEENNIDLNNIEQSINDMFHYKRRAFEFISGGDKEGDDIYQSPIWVRPKSLLQDMIDGYIQVVGHTPHKKVTIYEDKVVVIDALGGGQYLEALDEKMNIKTITNYKKWS